MLPVLAGIQDLQMHRGFPNSPQRIWIRTRGIQLQQSLPAARPRVSAGALAAIQQAVQRGGVLLRAAFSGTDHDGHRAGVVFPGAESAGDESDPVAGSMFSAIMWLIAFFKRRAAYCPLCKGTPLINSGALPHSRARRLFPLNHGVTATLSIIATPEVPLHVLRLGLRPAQDRPRISADMDGDGGE